MRARSAAAVIAVVAAGAVVPAVVSSSGWSHADAASRRAHALAPETSRRHWPTAGGTHTPANVPAPAPTAAPAPAPAPSEHLVPVRRIDLGATEPENGWIGETGGSSTITGGAPATPGGPVSADAWAGVYTTTRDGDFTLTMHGLAPRARYALRLHLAEGTEDGAGRRVFDVSVNGARAASGIDPYALAGGRGRATTRDVPASADDRGDLVVSVHATAGTASVAGLELLWSEPTRRDSFPAGRTTRVMAVGDSITSGVRDEAEGGYRFHLYDLMADAGWAFEPVGPYSGPGEGRWAGSGHLGVPGWRLEDLLGPTSYNTSGNDIDSWLRAARPDVVLLHMGNNDNEEHEDQARMRDELDRLLDRIVAARPDADVYVARVVNQGRYDADIARYDETVADAVVRHEIAGHHVRLVDMESAVGRGDFADGIHPNREGYQQMAQRWFDALGEH